MLASKGFGPKTEVWALADFPRMLHPCSVEVASSAWALTQRPKAPKPQRTQPLPEEGPAPVPEAGSGTREVSEAVNARILSRILAFSGLPVALALGLFPLFYYLKARVLRAFLWH